MNYKDDNSTGGLVAKRVAPNVPRVSSPQVDTRPDGLDGSGQHHGVPDLLDKTGIENNGQRNTIAPHAPERAENNGQRSKLDPATVSCYRTSFRYPGKKLHSLGEGGAFGPTAKIVRELRTCPEWPAAA